MSLLIPLIEEGTDVGAVGRGICAIPYEAYGVGESGYYREFERRAVLSIKCVPALSSSIPY